MAEARTAEGRRVQAENRAKVKQMFRGGGRRRPPANLKPMSEEDVQRAVEAFKRSRGAGPAA